MHATPTEIHDVAYGFSDAAPHITDCATCTRSLDRVRSERDALRRTLQAPPKTASRPWLGVAAAALFLVGVAAFIVMQPFDSAQGKPSGNAAVKQDKPRKPTLTELVQKFANGDDSVRAQILAAGAPAMHPLLVHRGTTHVDKLREDIRRAAAQGDSRDIPDLLDARRRTATYRSTLSAVLHDMRNGIAPVDWQAPWVLDPMDLSLSDKPVDVAFADDTDGQCIDKLCRATDTDFAYVYGGAVIAKPERLWPREAIVPEPLAEGEHDRMRALITELGDESAEKRDTAFAVLLKRGEPVLPLLEAGTKHADAQVAANCTALIAKLSVADARLAYPPASGSLQAFDRESDLKVKDIRAKRMSFVVKDLILKHTLLLFLAQWNGSEVVTDLPDAKVTTSIDASVWTALCFLTRPYGLDFFVEKGVVKIGTEAEIRAMRPAPPKRE